MPRIWTRRRLAPLSTLRLERDVPVDWLISRVHRIPRAQRLADSRRAIL